MKLDAPITDWSLEGRRRFVAENFDVVHEVVRSAFAAFARPFGEDRFLAAFRFTTLDDAAEWCVDRFTHADIDQEKLHTRTPALFTHVAFWLSQRETARGAKRKLAMLHAKADLARGARELRTYVESDDEDEQALSLDLGRFRSGIGASLKKLYSMSCAALVGRWLEGTSRWRADWFPGEAPPTPADETKKKRSLVRHDALFRFLCVHFGHLPGAANAAETAVRTWLFEPCSDQPPYRCSEQEIASRLPADVPRTHATIHRLRREGVARLIAAALDAITVPPEDDSILKLEYALRLLSLRPTTLTTYELDEGRQPLLAARLHALAEKKETKP